MRQEYFELEKIEQYANYIFTPQELSQLKFKTEQQLYGDILLIIKREFFGEKMVKEISHDFEYEKYTSFWQHFKADYFPKFLLKKFPPKTIKKTILKTTQIERSFYFPTIQGKDYSNYIIQDFTYQQSDYIKY